VVSKEESEWTKLTYTEVLVTKNINSINVKSIDIFLITEGSKYFSTCDRVLYFWKWPHVWFCHCFI